MVSLLVADFGMFPFRLIRRGGDGRHGSAVRDAADIHAPGGRILVDTHQPATVLADGAARFGEQVPTVFVEILETRGNDGTRFTRRFEIGDATRFCLDYITGDRATDGMRRYINQAVNTEREILEIMVEDKTSVWFHGVFDIWKQDDQRTCHSDRDFSGG